MSMNVDSFKLDKAGVSRAILKNKSIIPILQSRLKGKGLVSYGGDRITIKSINDSGIALSPRARAKAVMRNAKTPGQIRYAKYLFSQAGNE